MDSDGDGNGTEWTCAVKVVEIIRNRGAEGENDAAAATVAPLIRRAMREFPGPSRNPGTAMDIRDYIGKRAAKRGLVDVLELLAREGARGEEGGIAAPLFGWTVARRAATARQFGILKWLLSDEGGCEFNPAVAEAVVSSRAPVSDIIGTLGWIYSDTSCRRVYIEGLLSAVKYVDEGKGGGGGSAPAVLDWILDKWPGGIRILAASREIAAAILNDKSSSPVSDCIPALDWVFRKCPLGSLRLDEITSRVVAGSGWASDALGEGTVALFDWLYAAEKEEDRTGDNDTLLFNRHAAIEGAVCSGNILLLGLFGERMQKGGADDESAILTDPNTGALAARHGRVDSIRWLVETAGNILSPDAAACAFAYGQLAVLEYLYLEAGAPFGTWRGRGNAGASVATECWEFYTSHGDNWNCGIYPPVNVKPAAAAAADEMDNPGE